VNELAKSQRVLFKVFSEHPTNPQRRTGSDTS